ncbi:phage tail sheath family protein [Kaistia sp. MMO-174]|uniref:phage tail sheath family protein n=1 Tax=Kaistia sp. MMO-174 TaxID=3081256 RepID=UPI003015D230
MATAPYNHGIRIFDAGETPRGVDLDNSTSIAAIFTAPAADDDVWPLNEPVDLFSNDSIKRTALGAGGTGGDIFDALDDQGIVARVYGVRVAEGVSETPATKLEQTISNFVGSGANFSGVHAFKLCRQRFGEDPGLLIAPGYTTQRISNAANPVVSEFEGIAKRLKSIVVADAGGTDKAGAFAWAEDFTDGQRIFATWPQVNVWDTASSSVVARPLAARAAGLFVKRDKEKGGPYWSPSNQAVGGIAGTALPVSYYDGDSDHDANWLNERKLATVIDNRILWGNETLSSDPLWRFVNVRRTRDAAERSIVRAFRWAMDRNLGKHLPVAIIQSLDEFIDGLVAVGAVLGGRAFWLRDMNSNTDLRNGILRIEFDMEEAPPLQDLQFGSRRNVAYFDVLSEDILNALQQQVV